MSLYFLRLAKQSQFIPLQNVVYFITLPVLVRKTFTFYINDVLLFKCPVPGPSVVIGGVLALVWRRYRKTRKTKNVELVSGQNFKLDTD